MRVVESSSTEAGKLGLTQILVDYNPGPDGAFELAPFSGKKFIRVENHTPRKYQPAGRLNELVERYKAGRVVNERVLRLNQIASTLLEFEPTNISEFDLYRSETIYLRNASDRGFKMDSQTDHNKNYGSGNFENTVEQAVKDMALFPVVARQGFEMQDQSMVYFSHRKKFKKIENNMIVFNRIDAVSVLVVNRSVTEQTRLSQNLRLSYSQFF